MPSRRSVRSELSHVKGFGERALCSSTPHVSPFTSRLHQCPPIGKNDTAIETAIRTMMIHSSTSMRRVVARFDILL